MRRPQRVKPNAPKQYTFTRPVFYKVDSPLLPSGLLGPVRVVHMVADGSGSASR